jgi:Cys-tRNA(Pro) deacylase
MVFVQAIRQKMAKKELSSSAKKVQEALNQFGIELEVVEFPESTRTAADAARAIGCQVGQIAKSLIFKTKTSERPILIIASGANRVNEKKMRDLIGEKIVRPDAAFVRAETGFAIGGIPPLGHTSQLETYLDEDLMEFDTIWAAAGTPNAVFRLTPDQMKKITNGNLISVK